MCFLSSRIIYDYAVMKLASALPLGENIQPIKVAPADTDASQYSFTFS